ncbi:hypothetical protein SAMN05421757_105110 [Tropicimonas sediminicola]|uniref:Uncharacterized protein n=1 Tax=Tropicimonas sediminicola TaxID=1031541 RepID=A0A239J5B2_9RHOB|nr:hypothetical protein SAMN05421757_105110 [Tropicimonas sediminicola]
MIGGAICLAFFFPCLGLCSPRLILLAEVNGHGTICGKYQDGESEAEGGRTFVMNGAEPVAEVDRQLAEADKSEGDQQDAGEPEHGQKRVVVGVDPEKHATDGEQEWRSEASDETALPEYHNDGQDEIGQRDPPSGAPDHSAARGPHQCTRDEAGGEEQGEEM